MGTLKLSLFGGFEVHPIGRGPVAFPTRKADALVAYLAARPGRRHARDALSALLWGDSPEAKARANLRYTLTAIRRALGPDTAALVTEGQAIALDPTAVEVDVVELEENVAIGTPEALERAIALYRGDFLAGFPPTVAPFEEWLVGERERLRELALGALARLLAHQSRGDAVEPAIQTALHLLTLDPLQEVVHRALMRLYVRQGRRAAALHQYQACVATLERELGVEPATETRQLYLELLPPEREARLHRPDPLADSPDTPLVGRHQELGVLRDALIESARGRGRVCMLLGEAGVGKTRLLQALVAEGRLGSRTLAARAYESEQGLAFGLWANVLRAGGNAVDLAARSGLPLLLRAALTRILPEITERHAPVGTGPETAAHVFDAVALVLTKLAEREPLLVLLEDLQWADAMSVRVLGSLAHRLQALPVLVVATAREEDIADLPAVRDLLAELDRDVHHRQLALAPLSPADTQDLVRALARSGIGRGDLTALGDRVWQASGGNPFAAVETVRLLRQATAVPATAAVPLADRVRDIVRRRLERLSESGRRLATVAAVVGREFDFVLVQRASALGEREAAEALEELVRRRLVHGVGESFDFTHDRVRETIYRDTTRPLRQVTHTAVGRELERMHAGRLPEVYDQLAYHYARSSDDRNAVTYLTRFADQAARRYALADAAGALEDALVRAERLPVAERDQARMDVVLRRGRALSFLGRLGDALDLLLGERERVERLADPRLAGRYHFLMGNTYSNLGQPEPAVASAERALAEAERCGDDGTIGRAHFLLALEAFWSGPFTHGVAHARQAVSVFEHGRRQWWLGFAHWTLGVNHTLLGEFEAALAAQAAAAAIGEAIGDVRLMSGAAWTAGGTHALAGNETAAIAACERGLETAPDPLSRACAQGWLGYALLTKGEPPPAITLLEQAVEGFERFRFRAHGWFMAWLAEAHLDDGRPEQAQELARKALELAAAARQSYGVGIAQRALGRCARAAGDVETARTHLGEALATFRAVEARFEIGRTHLELAWLTLAAADLAAAAAHVRESEAMFAALGLPAWRDRATALTQAGS